MQEKIKKRKILIIISIIILLIGILFLGLTDIKNNQKKNLYQLKNKSSYEVTLKPIIFQIIKLIIVIILLIQLKILIFILIII